MPINIPTDLPAARIFEEENIFFMSERRAHSQDMIDRNFFDHTNPDGKSPFDRMRDNGLSYSMAAENIAVGYPSPEAVVEGWMNSEGHRANILGGCKELGVGLALGGSYGSYWTQCFATVR